MANATKEQVNVLLDILRGLLEAVKLGGSLGVPAGHMYAMLMSKVSLDEFNMLMGMLIKSGKVRLRNHCYYYVD